MGRRLDVELESRPEMETEGVGTPNAVPPASGPVRPSRAARASSRFLWHLLPLFLAALPALLAIYGGQDVRAARWDPWGILAWGALLILAEALPVPMIRAGTMTIASILDVGAILLFGPWVAGGLDLVTTVVAQMLILRRPASEAILNAGLYASTTILAGAAYLAAGGTLGAPQLGRDLMPLLLAGSLYFMLNTGAVSLVLATSTGEDPGKIWKHQFRDGVPQYALSIGFGLLFAQVRVAAGIGGALLLVLPLLFARYALQLYADLRGDLVSFVRALSVVLDAVDPYTHEHSVRVAEYSVRVARRLGLRDEEVETIHYAALCHDIGKIAQRPEVIRKPDALDAEERRHMMRHPEAGARIVGQIRALRTAAAMVRTHHWRPDGRGYPKGLTDAEVPLGARIIHVCDAFDAMTSDRPYRKGLPVPRALSELSRHAGSQFDPRAVAALAELHEAGELLAPRDSELVVEDIR